MISKQKSWFLLFSFIAIISLVAGVFTGSSRFTLNQLFQSGTLANDIFWHIRLPHTLTAFVTGALLALSGALMQALTRNPLADPYIMGVSGGAAVGALLLVLLGFEGYWLTAGSWFGAMLAITGGFWLSIRQQSFLLLNGIALASGFSALISIILLLSPDHTLRVMLFWLMGDLETSKLPVLEMIILIFGLILSLSLARELNILVRGRTSAKALGVNIQHLQMMLFLLSSLLAATAVTLAGCIGFIGLVIPHIVRLVMGYDHRILIPTCVIVGGSFLTVADTLSRLFFFPQILPVGLLMTLIGIPIFIYLLQKNVHDDIN